MSTPLPRPALRKSADAHIHPAAPGHPQHVLKPAPPESTNGSAPEEDPEGEAGALRDAHETLDAGQHRLSGPLRGTTSDSVRNAARGARHPPRRTSADKPVNLDVRVPKSLRKEFRAAVKADKKDPDAVVTALLKAWLDT